MKELIRKIVDVCYKNKEGHIPSSLSILDILFVYLKNFRPENLVLSKGHSAIGLYVTLDFFGLLGEDLDGFCKHKSLLMGHPTHKLKNVVFSTGSLGHGLPMAVGLALSKKHRKETDKICVIIGDGECNEGTIWESIMVASNHNLNNLVCIVDFNHSGDRALFLGNISDKFKSFGCDTIEIDGHNHEEILQSLETQTEKPLVIIANTIKGKGIKSLENNPEWHHKIPNESEYLKITNEI